MDFDGGYWVLGTSWGLEGNKHLKLENEIDGWPKTALGETP